ncbi:MAG: hypothetical protein NDI69_00420 [Bacteriovoracaceae bacterium]|nr:hypothetical protein [Bacteriovoracaceae bacterium]
MRISYLLFFVSLSVFSQTSPQIQVIPNPKSIDDFDHQFKGCLENSECDQVMGLQLTRWKDLITKVKEDNIQTSKKAQYIELFRNKYGIPVEFYTTQKSQQGFKPLLFNSHCKNHNPKNPEDKILKGMAFIKGISNERVVVWRDQTQIEVPISDLLTPQPVIVYGEKETKSYFLPIDDQPLFIKNNEIYVLKEEDGLFFTLKIAENGDWKIEDLDFTKLSEWEEKRSEVACPKDSTKLAPKAFGVEFCKTVWNEDLKKTVIVKMHQGCII